jgi:hypothetical protein
VSSPPSEPAPGSQPDTAQPVETRPGPRPPGVRNAFRARLNPRERSYWQLIPRRNFRLALLLLALIVGVVALKRSGALSFSRMFDAFAPPVRTRTTDGKSDGTFQHIEVRPAPPKRP